MLTESYRISLKTNEGNVEFKLCLGVILNALSSGSIISGLYMPGCVCKFGILWILFGKDHCIPLTSLDSRFKPACRHL